MSAPRGTVRQSTRPYGRRSNEAQARPRSTTDSAPPMSSWQTDATTSEKSEPTRRDILDAALACFADYGWSGTNMSVIARRSGMTRGRIQYYFPTQDDLLRAAIDHLMVEWRQKYFGMIAEAAGTPARFDHGIKVLWRLMQDPLYVARQELEASARTNSELRELMQRASGDDEEASVQAVKQAFPDLAQHGDAAVRRARNFTNVFMEGLALHRFGQDAEARQAEMIQMLRSFLLTYWGSLGVETLEVRDDAREEQTRPAAPSLSEEDRERALALLREAAALISSSPTK